MKRGRVSLLFREHFFHDRPNINEEMPTLTLSVSFERTDGSETTRCSVCLTFDTDQSSRLQTSSLFLRMYQCTLQRTYRAETPPNSDRGRQSEEKVMRNMPYRPTVTHVQIPSTCSSGISIVADDNNQCNRSTLQTIDRLLDAL